MTWNGIMSVAITSQKQIVEPRNCMRARAYAHIESNSRQSAVVTPAKMKLFSTRRRNGSSSQMLV